MVIIGAGFTGLWTAFYLSADEPALHIAVIESEVAGFGASGRNGGWCSALFPSSLESLAARAGGGVAGRSAAMAQHQAMRATVDEVARAAVGAGIEAQLAKGGTITLARNAGQLARARAEVESARRWSRGDDELTLLNEAQASAILRGSRTVGATYTPDCAALHPARLVRGLARAVEQRGVQVFERTRATSIGPGQVTTDRGTVRARFVVRATEGYTPRISGQRRGLIPVYSLMIATEPLSKAAWDEIGLARRETFADHRHLIIYGQRTSDDRLVFGGRGAPYHFGSRVSPAFDRDDRVFARLHSTLLDLFPVLGGTRFSHAWGGPLGIARDWTASVGLDRVTGLAWAGGYVGDGVSTANLAGRTLRDLILGHDTDLTRLPWVGHRSPAWEPEPLRWLGVNAGLRTMALADREEAITGRPSVVAGLMAPLLGG